MTKVHGIEFTVRISETSWGDKKMYLNKAGFHGNESSSQSLRRLNDFKVMVANISANQVAAKVIKNNPKRVFMIRGFLYQFGEKIEFSVFPCKVIFLFVRYVMDMCLLFLFHEDWQSSFEVMVNNVTANRVQTVPLNVH